MEHPEFVQRYRSGALLVHVDRSLALQVMSGTLLPARYRAAHLFWSWVWLLSIPTFIALAFLYRWWVGGLLLVVTPALSNGVKRSACDFVLEHALADDGFFKLALEKGILRVEARPLPMR